MENSHDLTSNNLRPTAPKGGWEGQATMLTGHIASSQPEDFDEVKERLFDFIRQEKARSTKAALTRALEVARNIYGGGAFGKGVDAAHSAIEELIKNEE